MATTETVKTNKVCVTCNYWSGVRQPPKGNTIKAESANIGECYYKKDTYKKKTKIYDRCSNWEKWSII